MFILIALSILFFFFGAVRAVSSLNGKDYYHVGHQFMLKIRWIFPRKMLYAVGLVAIGWTLAATIWWFYGLDWSVDWTIVAIGCFATSIAIQRLLRALWKELWHALTN